MIRFAILILTTLVASNSFGQDTIRFVHLDSTRFASNLDSIKGFIAPAKEGIIFYCPSNVNIEDSLYVKYLQDIKDSYRIDSSISVVGISYKQQKAMRDQPSIDSVMILDMDCFVVVNDTVNLSRASRINNSFNHYSEGLPNGIFRIVMVDGVQCPDNLATKISSYNKYLYETFHPIYKSKERIELLEKQVEKLKSQHQREIAQLKKQIEDLTKQIIDLDKRKKDVKQ